MSMVKQWLGSGLLALCLLGVSIEPVMAAKGDKDVKHKELKKELKKLNKEADDIVKKEKKLADKRNKLGDKMTSYNKNVASYNSKKGDEAGFTADTIDTAKFWGDAEARLQKREKEAAAKKEKAKARMDEIKKKMSGSKKKES